MRGQKTGPCQLQVNIPTPTGTGSSDSWITVEEFRAVLVPVSQSEQQIADKDTTFAAYTLNIDHSDIREQNVSEMNVNSRVRIGDKFYDIKGVAEHLGRGKHWQLRLEDVTDQTEA